MGEYFHNPYNFLKKNIELWNERKIELRDENIVVWADDFVTVGSFKSIDQVNFGIGNLIRWPWLRLIMGK